MDRVLAETAFPWLDPRRFRWLRGIADLQPSDAIAKAAGAAIESHSQWFIPVLAPYVPANFRLIELDLSARPSNRLDDAGLRLFADLDTWSISRLLNIRSMGAGSVDEIVRALFRENFRRAGASDAHEAPRPDAEDLWIPDEPPHRSLAAANLETLARWSLAIGEPGMPLVEVAPDDERLPPRSTRLQRGYAAFQRLMSASSTRTSVHCFQTLYSAWASVICESWWGDC